MEGIFSTFISSNPKFEGRSSPLSLFSLYVFLALVVYLVAVYRRGHRRGEDSERSAGGRTGRRRSDPTTVLLVIAHPDDECMFFAPSILTLNSNPTKDVHILCLSNGNYYGDGAVREKELLASSVILGIPPRHVSILNERDMQDDPAAVWDEDTVSRHILRHIIKCDAKMVLTFDKNGVSSHPNHTAAYKGVRKLVVEKSLPSGVRAYCLESVRMWRRFISFLELPVSFVLSAARGSKVLVSCPHGVWRAQRALRAHTSQFVWFRKLNMLFSRYFIVNTIRTITVKNSS